MWGKNVAFLIRFGDYWASLETEGLLERYCRCCANKEAALARAVYVEVRRWLTES